MSRRPPSGSGEGTSGPSVDIGWQYATALDSKKQKTKCNFCDKNINGGGITRLKQHLAGSNPNVAKCPKVPREVYQLMQNHLRAGTDARAGKQRLHEQFMDAVFDRRSDERGEDEDSDDDFNYPPDCITDQEKAQYRHAIRVTRDDQRQQHQEDAFRRRSVSHASGSGSTSFGGSQLRGLAGTTRTSSMREGRASIDSSYYKSQETKQPKIKNVLGNMRERVGKAAAKFFFFNSIPANAAKGVHFQHMIDEASRSTVGVKAPTPYEIMHKYLDGEKQELDLHIAELKKQWPVYGVTVMKHGYFKTPHVSVSDTYRIRYSTDTPGYL